MKKRSFYSWLRARALNDAGQAAALVLRNGAAYLAEASDDADFLDRMRDAVHEHMAENRSMMVISQKYPRVLNRGAGIPCGRRSRPPAFGPGGRFHSYTRMARIAKGGRDAR
jgi:hypothetical protein